MIAFFEQSVSFWKRQTRNWRIAVTRQFFNRFLEQLTGRQQTGEGYTNIYIRSLGASPVELGLVNSVTGISSAIISIPMGWLQDRYSLRKIFVISLSLLMFVPLIYATANNWTMVIPAVLLYVLAGRFGSCVVICDISLKRDDRATGKSLCEGYGSAPSLFAPTIAALIIMLFGGISTNSIRPLYWIQFVGGCLLFLFVASRMTEIARPPISNRQFSFLADVREVFERGTALKRWIFFYALFFFATSMASPFRMPFANEIKGANQFIIGGMVTAWILIQVLFAHPFGKLADKIGRKKVFYLLTPIFLLSYVVLVFTPIPELLILEGALNGFWIISQIITIGAMTPELVPSDCVGRWRGILGMVSGLASIPAPILGGIIWEVLNPAYVFLFAGILLLLSIYVISTVPEMK